MAYWRNDTDGRQRMSLSGYVQRPKRVRWRYPARSAMLRTFSASTNRRINRARTSCYGWRVLAHLTKQGGLSGGTSPNVFNVWRVIASKTSRRKWRFVKQFVVLRKLNAASSNSTSESTTEASPSTRNSPRPRKLSQRRQRWQQTVRSMILRTGKSQRYPMLAASLHGSTNKVLTLHRLLKTILCGREASQRVPYLKRLLCAPKLARVRWRRSTPC